MSAVGHFRPLVHRPDLVYVDAWDDATDAQRKAVIERWTKEAMGHVTPCDCSSCRARRVRASR